MKKTVIQVENLSKRYIIGQNTRRANQHPSIRDALTNSINSFKNKAFLANKTHAKDQNKEFWALKDVCFEVEKGNRIGIIGRNGAGKSTLLKILSRITDPTSGSISLQGRAASLLEVGTGFHPELTGRENIYLNGAILGMSKAEVKSKFDEIVNFAEIEKFIDTPVKRYSSGMYVRLAFAVAAHLDPEILIVDEVLAVGDIQFQKKCLGKMEDVAVKEGRTLLFVSHDMSAIQTLCSQVVFLEAGKVKGFGPTAEQIEFYLNSFKDQVSSTLDKTVKLSEELYITKIEFLPNQIRSGDPVNLELKFFSTISINISELQILIYSSLNTRIAMLDLRNKGGMHKLSANNYFSISGTIDSLPLVQGDYHIGIFINSTKVSGDFFDIVKISVFDKINSNGLIPYERKYRGVLDLEFDFSSHTTTTQHTLTLT